MGYDINLLEPDRGDPETVVHRYYDYLQEKRNRLGLEGETYVTGKRERAIERLSDGWFYIYERIPRDAPEYWDTERFRDLCSVDELVDGCVLRNDDISLLIDLLREAKERLQDERPEETNWELTLEGQAIALCEYALDEGYAVELTPS